MDEAQQTSLRLRLQTLLAIPERQRADAEWDELNELEIKLAAGNREGAPEQGVRWNSATPGGRSQPGSEPRGRNAGKRFHPRPPKRNTP